MVEIETETTVKMIVNGQDLPSLEDILGYCDLERMRKEVTGEQFDRTMVLFTEIGAALDYVPQD